MSIFGINMGLAFAWAALTGSFSFVNLVIGYTLGYAALWLAQPLFAEPSTHFTRSWSVLRLIAVFLWELVISSIQVVWDVLTPEHKSIPRIVEMPLDVRSEFGILIITNFISLTPGTLSLDVSPDRRKLFVHAMFADDPDAVIAQLKRYERYVMEAIE
jgi:multicomponent Na+:H+ antiporter subunit E